MKFLNEAVDFIPPLKNFRSVRVSDSFGSKRETGIHKGTDFAVSSGTKLYAIADGIITYAQDDSKNCGGRIDVEHKETSYLSRYCHVRQFTVKNGQKVKQGQLLGYSGGGKNDPFKGRTDGAHLHFAVLRNNIPVNPMNIIDKSKAAKYSDKGDDSLYKDDVKTRTIGDFSVAPNSSKVGTFSVAPNSSKVGNFSVAPDSSKVGTFSVAPNSSKVGNFSVTNESLDKEIDRIKILLK